MMAAFPFQSWPSLSKYCEWLESVGGRVETGGNEWGRYTRLISPDGKRYVHAPELDDDEVIGPEKLAEIETRLKIESPWTPRLD